MQQPLTAQQREELKRLISERRRALTAAREVQLDELEDWERPVDARPFEERSTLCIGCGIELDRRSRGCRACKGRHNRRMSEGRPYVPASEAVVLSPEEREAGKQRARAGRLERQTGPRRMIEADEIVAAIHEYVEKYGTLPTYHGWKHKKAPGETRPSTTAMQRVFGSFNGAIRAAGYTPRAPHGTKLTYMTRAKNMATERERKVA